MINFAAAAGAAGLLLAVTTGAQAIPLSDTAYSASNELVLVSGGCGPYGHRGPFGYCQPGGQWGEGARPFGWRPVCPPGYHLGPYRHACWPN